MVSDQHANFIVTSPDATARHVLHLIEEVRTRVQEHCGVLLQQEVVVWSRDEDVRQ
jgi:UDP-N-acetylenolpyruvoylglucosamine reductase